MFKYLLAVSSIFLAGMTATAVPKPISITLNKSNLVLLRGEIDDAMITKTILATEALPTNNPVLFIQSPGGSIMAGLQYIQYMKDSGKKFTCVVDFAASMAFVIFQSCDERIILGNGQLMQHQASFGVSGPVEYMKSQYNYISTIIDDLEVMQAKRIGVPLEKFKSDRLSDLWLFGNRAVAYGAADKVFPVRCDKELWKGEYSEIEQISIFKVKITYSTCPLIRGPLKMEPISGGAHETPDNVKEKVMEMWTNLPKAIEEIKTKLFN